MDKDVLDYRTKHPNCVWCKHHHYKCRLEWAWEECELNERWLHDWLHGIRARLCKYYKVKENDKDNEV